MANPGEHSVLRRMVAPPRPPHSRGGGAVNRAVKIRFPRSADDLLGLTVEVQATVQSIVDTDEILSALSPEDLVFAVSAERGGGIVVIDKAMLAALVEVQTTGRVTRAPPQDRLPTRADAIVVGDMVDRWLTDIGECLKEAPGAPFLMTGTTRRERILDPRSVGLMLDPIAYHSLRIELDVARGAKSGALRLIFPARGHDQEFGAPDGDLASALQPHLGAVRTRMRAVLGHVTLPLADVVGLTSDRVFPLISDDIRQVTLVHTGRAALGEARLGQINGTWAVRPVGDPQTDHRKLGFAPPVFDKVSVPDMPTDEPVASVPANPPDTDALPDPLPEWSDDPDLQGPAAS